MCPNSAGDITLGALENVLQQPLDAGMTSEVLQQTKVLGLCARPDLRAAAAIPQLASAQAWSSSASRTDTGEEGALLYSCVSSFLLLLLPIAWAAQNLQRPGLVRSCADAPSQCQVSACFHKRPTPTWLARIYKFFTREISSTNFMFHITFEILDVLCHTCLHCN